MKKKFGTVLLACLMAFTMAISFTGCKPQAKSDFVMPEGGFDTTKEVTIEFSHTMGQKLRGVLKPYVEEFMKLYPNIKIEHYDDVRDSSKYEELYSMISTQIIAGKQPNIAYCYSDHVAGYNTATAVQSLDDFLPGGAYADYKVKQVKLDANGDPVTDAAGNYTYEEVPLGLTAEQVSMFIPGYYNEGKVFADGKMYTLPFSKSTEVLYYNKTVFDDNGWTAPKTWEEMETLCRAIKAKYPTSIPLGYDSEANWFITMCEQYGSPYTSATGDKYLFDNQTNRQFVTEFAEWYQDGLVTTQMLNNDTYTSDLFTETGVDSNGNPLPKAYMCIGSTAGASYQQSGETQGKFEFEVGITRIPQVNPDKPKVISQGPSVCIFKDDDPQKVIASWLFIKYLTTNINFQAEFSIASGYVPVLTNETMSQNQVFVDLLDQADGEGNLTALSAKVCMDQENAYFTSPAFVGSAEARVQVGILLQAVLAHPDEIDAIFRSALTECRKN